MSPDKKYKNPPLVEAVFEFFYHTSEWSPVIPGIFYNEIKEKFPNISQDQNGFGFSVESKGFQFGGGFGLTQYRNIRGNSIIQLSNNLLTVNKLPEYDGWDSYLELIKYSLKALAKVLAIEKVNRIGIKTLNKIEINSLTYSNFKKNFTIYPLIPANVNTELSSIQFSFESPINDKNDILAVSLKTLKKEEKYEAPVMFQLYVTRIKEISIDSIEEWLEKAHMVLKETFDNSLTKKCKNKFE